jgi:hypothetical protein
MQGQRREMQEIHLEEARSRNAAGASIGRLDEQMGVLFGGSG